MCEKLDRVNNCVIRRDLSLTFLPLLGFWDVCKGRWSLWEIFFKHKYCHACHTGFVNSFPFLLHFVLSLLMLKWECQGSNIYFFVLNGIYVGSKYATKIDCLQSCPYNFFQSFSIEMPFLNLFGHWLVRLVIAACLLIDETCVLTWLFVLLHVMRGKSIYQRHVTRLQAFNAQTVQKKCTVQVFTHVCVKLRPYRSTNFDLIFKQVKN